MLLRNTERKNTLQAEVMVLGLLSDIFFPKLPSVPTIMPPGAVQDILSGKLPLINSGHIILRKGEQCCYIDKAILLETKEEKMYVRSGTSMPGIFEGTRYTWGTSKPRTYEKTVRHQAIDPELSESDLKKLYKQLFYNRNNDTHLND